MQSAVAESLFHRLIESFPPRRVYAPAAFEHEPMPSPVAHFLKHWLQHRLRHEASQLELPRSEWFYYEAETVQQARRNLAGALIENGHFPATAWKASLHEAVQQVTAYLVRPATTLGGFIFQKESRSVPVSVLQWRVGYFKDYRYFHEAATLYVEEYGEEHVEQGSFTQMLHAIEQKVTKDYDAEAWLGLLAPLFDLARRAGIGQGVPLLLLIAFFQDKNAPAIVERLARLQHTRSVEALDEG